METPKKILVTGAGGFFGSHVVERLLASGHEVRALCRYTSSRGVGWLAGNTSPNLEVVMADVRDTSRMLDIVEGVDGVIHLAALVSVPHSFTDPGAHLAVNLQGTANLLEAVRVVGVRHFVFVSSSEVYGSARFVPIDESHPLRAQSPYAASKIAAESLCESYRRAFDLPLSVVRPFNLFGPRQSARAVIPAIISQALVTDKLRLGRTDVYRDFNFVVDSAENLTRILHSEPLDGPLNLGSGETRSIADVVDAVAEILGKPLTVVRAPERLRPTAAEVTRLHADTSRMRALFPNASRTPFFEALALTITDLEKRNLGTEYAV